MSPTYKDECIDSITDVIRTVPAGNGDRDRRQAEALLQAMLAGCIPDIYHASAIPDATQDAMRQIDRLRVQQRDSYNAAMTALSELDKAKARIVELTQHQTRRVVAVSVAGCDNTIETQTNVIAVALCNDGSMWCSDLPFKQWDRLPDIPSESGAP